MHKHFPIEPQTPFISQNIQGPSDFLFEFKFSPFTGLQIARRRPGRRADGRNSASWTTGTRPRFTQRLLYGSARVEGPNRSVACRSSVAWQAQRPCASDESGDDSRTCIEVRSNSASCKRQVPAYFIASQTLFGASINRKMPAPEGHPFRD